MKKISTIILMMITAFYANGQSFGPCALKIGNSYYINCKSVITIKEQSILSIPKDDTIGIHPNFDVFDKTGSKIAGVSEGKLVEGDDNLFIIKSSPTEYSFVEKSSKRIICYLKKGYNEEKHWCELAVWADMYLPGGSYFQCTPEITNIPFLNNMQGATFKNARAAIQLN